MDRGAWKDTVHRVADSQTWLKRLSTDKKYMRRCLRSLVNRKMPIKTTRYHFIPTRKIIQNKPKVLVKMWRNETLSLWLLGMCNGPPALEISSVVLYLG